MKTSARKSRPAVRTVGVGLIGLGTVGGGVCRILQTRAAQIEKRTGLRLVLRRVCVRSLSKRRDVRVRRSLVTSDWRRVVRDPSVDVVVELIGGLHPAREILLESLEAGKHVVTANKALLAERGDDIFAAARRNGRRIGFEASVCGGIPILKSLKEGLASNEIERFLGIVNGTCNYILSAMSGRGIGFDEALAQAKAQGYAEQDPTLDIDGIDSAHKLAVLARLAFGVAAPLESIHVEGIRRLSSVDIEYARQLGYAVKLLAVGRRTAGGFELRVHPALLPKHHPLAGVDGVYNAVFLHADQAGDLLFYGRGAGRYPTASAVMGDLIEIAAFSGSNAPADAASTRAVRARALPAGESVNKFYLRFQAVDRPGVLGMIARELGRGGISILSVHQKESHVSRSVPIVILTYDAREKDLRRALARIDARPQIASKTVVMRMAQ